MLELIRINLLGKVPPEFYFLILNVLSEQEVIGLRNRLSLSLLTSGKAKPRDIYLVLVQ